MGDFSTNDLVKTITSQVKEVVSDKDNQMVAAVSGLAWFLSPEDKKERNAIIAGLVALAFLTGKEQEDAKDSK